MVSYICIYIDEIKEKCEGLSGLYQSEIGIDSIWI